MSEGVREYSHAGLSGCVQQQRARSTGTLVGVYHGPQASIEVAPEQPWVSVCEEHGVLAAHSTLALAKYHAADPAGWCEECSLAGDSEGP